MSETHPKPHAIVFPFPFHGHITPMLNLSIKLASKGFTITFILTEFIHHTIFNGSNLFLEAQKSGLDMRYITISDGFAIEFDRIHNNDEYWESMMTHFPCRFDEIVRNTIISSSSSSSSNFLLITDTLHSWASTIARKHSIINVSLWTGLAIGFSIGYHLHLFKENGDLPFVGSKDKKINYIPGIRSICFKDTMSFVQDPDAMPVLLKIAIKAFDQVKNADFILFNTVQELESETMSSLNIKHQCYAIGPMNFFSENIYKESSIVKSLWAESDCSQWLNSKPQGSVLYISFGTLARISKQEMEEIANGLLLSKVNFIWTIRADISDPNEFNILPFGFEDGLKDRGLVVPWCNQNIILSSPAIGGFLTHCGWNSILESIWFGVPMICYPLMVDQATNRKLVVEDWKIGINLCDGNKVSREEVSSKINFMIKDKKCIDELKNEMNQVRKMLHNALDIGGSSQINFDQFVDALVTYHSVWASRNVVAESQSTPLGLSEVETGHQK